MLTDGSDVLQRGQQARVTGLSQAQGRLACAAFFSFSLGSGGDETVFSNRLKASAFKISNERSCTCFFELLGLALILGLLKSRHQLPTYQERKLATSVAAPGV